MTFLIGRSGFRLRFWLVFAAALPADIRAGRFQWVVGGGEGCRGKKLAGGVVPKPAFGKRVTPNITPHKQPGIGDYAAADFPLAMKGGVRPGGKRFYPAMPYPS